MLLIATAQMSCVASTALYPIPNFIENIYFATIFLFLSGDILQENDLMSMPIVAI